MRAFILYIYIYIVTLLIFPYIIQIAFSNTYVWLYSCVSFRFHNMYYTIVETLNLQKEIWFRFNRNRNITDREILVLYYNKYIESFPNICVQFISLYYCILFYHTICKIEINGYLNWKINVQKSQKTKKKIFIWNFLLLYDIFFVFFLCVCSFFVLFLCNYNEAFCVNRHLYSLSLNLM